MIDKTKVISLVEEFLGNGDVFLVGVEISPDNEIVVEIDSDQSVDIDTCCDITRFIEDNLSRDVEDYSLEVGSSGLTAPLKLPRQYKKNIGNELEVLAAGKKHVGTLVAADEEGFTIEESGKEKGKKITKSLEFKYSDIEYAKYNLKFK